MFTTFCKLREKVDQNVLIHLKFKWILILQMFFFFLSFFLFVVNFVIHWNETAMGLHVFPIPMFFVILGEFIWMVQSN